MRRALFIVLFVVLIFVDLSVLSQTVLLIELAGIFSKFGDGAIWLPAIVIALAVTGGLVWLTVLVWRAIRATYAAIR